MKKIIVAVLVLVMLAAAYYGTKIYVGNKAAELYETGYEKLEKKEFKSAIEDFDRSLSFADYGSWLFAEELVKEHRSRVYAQRAWCYMQLNQYETALEDFNKAEELGFTRPELYSNRGWTKNHLEQYEDAMIDLKKAIDMGPNYSIVDTYQGLANSYRMLEKYEESVKYYDKAIESDSAYASAYMGRGFVYNSLENYEEAIHDFTKAIEMEYHYNFAYYGRGVAYKDLNMIEKAKADFQKALEFDTEESDELIAFRGLAYHELGKYDEAIADFNRAYKIKEHPWLLKCLGDSYKKLDQNEKAAEYYNKYLKLAGNKYHDEDEVKESLKEIRYEPKI
jgi:tetratricopeptide (TPR) repeat protein